jgi:TRAP-type mannitol/chloroaromatic compound transport system permease small subunit
MRRAGARQAGELMQVQKFLYWVDNVSTWCGKAFAWLIAVLMLIVCAEVAKRYFLNDPSSWFFDITAMMYGVTFMMCGAYTLAQDGHVRGDFLYGSMKPRTQASLDLVLYILFFIPGIAALCYAGWDFAATSWAIREHSSVTADGPPLYHFKTFIPIAGALVMLQGVAEIVRCVVCVKTGKWPERLKDAEEIDVVEQQLAKSTHVDEESRKRAIESVHDIDEAAHQRGLGDRAAEEVGRHPDGSAK